MDWRKKGSQLRGPRIMADAPKAALMRTNAPRFSVLAISGQTTTRVGAGCGGINDASETGGLRRPQAMTPE